MPNRKMLLIEPPFYRLFRQTYGSHIYPLSLGYLAGAVMTKTSWGVMTYNADFTPRREEMKLTSEVGEGFYNYQKNLKDLSAPIWQEIKRAILDYSPDIVGISVKTQNFTSACNVAHLVKEIDSCIPVIIGGPHVCMAGKDAMNNSDIDIAVKGEGEETLTALLEYFERGKDPGTIKGIFFRKGREIMETAAREYIRDLDSLPFPNENAPATLRDYGLYPPTAFGRIFSSRGCPFNCSFCGSHKIWSRVVRFRSPANVVSEIKSMQRMGLRSVIFEDDTFGVSKEHLVNLCEAIRENCPTLKWSCEIHVKLVDDAIISLMKNAGCFSMRLGIESGNNEMLKKIRKGITIEEALSACRIIKKHDIELHVFYMVGFPDETEQTLSDTIEAMRRTECDKIIYSIFTPYPGTDLFDLCKARGLIGDGFDTSLFSHSSPLNYFCPNMSREVFRSYASRIEKMVDRKNAINRIKRIFSANSIWRVRELGLVKSLRRGFDIIKGR